MQSLYKRTAGWMTENDERSTIEYCSEHFRSRLYERYNILISHEEYLQLNELRKKKGYRVLYFMSSMKKVGLLNIQDTDIIVVMDNWRRVFITCLIKDELYPVPNTIRQLGITKEEFNEDLKEAIKEIVHLAEWLKSHPDEKTFFFKHKPFNKPEWMYKSAYGMIKFNDFIHPNKTIIDNLYENREI